MKPLSEDLQTPKYTLDEFADTTKRILLYLPHIVTNRVKVKNYAILSSTTAGTIKFARPINADLFINEVDEFINKYSELLTIIDRIQAKGQVTEENCKIVDSVVYTIQQSIGVGMDFLCNPNSSRKHAGNRFEELIRIIVSRIGVANDKIVLKIPYPAEEGEKLYSCETDIILSPHEKVRSNIKEISKNEIIISLKTSSKDRMGKIFLDKLLMQKFSDHPVKVVGIFLNDVQRKETKNVSYTFVSGLFMVYTKFLTPLDGVYFVDPPPITHQPLYKEHIAPFSKFIAHDIWKLLAP